MYILLYIYMYHIGTWDTVPVHMIAKEFSFKRSQELLKYVSKDFLGDGWEIALESLVGKLHWDSRMGVTFKLSKILYIETMATKPISWTTHLYILLLYYYINSTQVHQGPVACKGTCGPDRSCKMLLPRDTM